MSMFMNPWLVWRDEQQHSSATGDSPMESTADYTAVADGLPVIVSNPSSALLVVPGPSCEKSGGGGGGHSPPPALASLTPPALASLTPPALASLTPPAHINKPSWVSTTDHKIKHSTPSPSPSTLLFEKDFANSGRAHLPPSGAGAAGDTAYWINNVIDPNGTSSFPPAPNNNHLRLQQQPPGAATCKAYAKAQREIIYREAVMRPVYLGPETAEWDRPRGKRLRLSDDPQTVAARRRRERISDRLWVLKRLVPGGINMDTATMLDEACSYLRFLKSQLSSADRSMKSVQARHVRNAGS